MGALDALYRETYEAMRGRSLFPSRRKDFRIRFYPYAGLKSTIAWRGGRYEVKLGDVLEAAPLDVHASLARILISKVERRLLVARHELATYKRWANSPAAVAAHERSRRERRAVKRIDPPEGRFHDLTLLYHKLNREYFDAVLPSLELGWSRNRSRSLWGHHDDTHRAIVLNRVLDHPRVPNFVVESILHHEMLHEKHGIRYTPGRRIVHSAEFRQDEKRYAHHAAAKSFLKDLAHRRIRLREPVAPNP